MSHQYKDKKHSKIRSKSTFLGARKVLLSVTILVLFFITTFSDNIKAQIASIISEDGDGIVGITSLMNATINEDVQAVKFFAKSGVAIVNQKNIGGATALHIASRNGSVEIAKILIENGANVNVADNEGWTPIMRAALSKNPELIKIFLNVGADPRKMNSSGETAIIHASSSGCLECLEQMFFGYNFLDNVDVDVLRNQLGLAMIIANNKNSAEIQSLLREYSNEEMRKSKTNILPNLNNDNDANANNNNSRATEMPAIINKNDGSGVVIVKSLDDKNNSITYKFNNLAPKKRSIVDQPSKKPIYKFLSKKDAVEQTKMVPVYQNDSPITTSNNPNKTNKEMVYKDNVFSLKINSDNKKFIFNGSKKPYIPYITTPINIEPKTTIYQLKTGDKSRVINNGNGSNKSSLEVEAAVSNDENKKPTNTTPATIINNIPPVLTSIASESIAKTTPQQKYKFLGQKSAPLIIKNDGILIQDQNSKSSTISPPSNQ